MMLVKSQGWPTYLFSKNPQIRIWHKRLGYASNAKVRKTSKLKDGIEITIKDNLSIENLSFNSGIDDKDKCKDLGQTLIANDKHERFFLLMAIINDYDNSEIEKLFDTYIENKNTIIVRHKKMTLTTKMLQKIYADL